MNSKLQTNMEVFPQFNLIYSNLLLNLVKSKKTEDFDTTKSSFDYTVLKDGNSNVLDFERDNKLLNNEFVLPSSLNHLI
ncbi:MAG: hypothetical protein ACXW07_06765 [Nitrososphaeraceae archaeon]